MKRTAIQILMFFVLLTSTYTDDAFIELAAKGSIKEIGDAIQAGADINAKNEYGNTALMWAVSFNKNPDVISTLIDAGANVNAIDGYGYSVLMSAIRDNTTPEIITILIKAGAQIDIISKNGATALMLAGSHSSNPDIIRTLVDYGANLNAKDHKGDTFWDYIQRNMYFMGIGYDEYLELQESLQSNTDGRIFEWDHFNQLPRNVQKGEVLFKQGEQQYKLKEYGEAARLVGEAILLYPRADFYFILGDIYYDMNAWENAAKAYRISGTLHYERSDYSFYNAACSLSLFMDEEVVDVNEVKRLLHLTFQAGYNHFDYIRKDSDMKNAFKYNDIKALVDHYEKLTENDKLLVGLWQETSPRMADTWGETISFFPDGSFIRRERHDPSGTKGNWEIRSAAESDGLMLFQDYIQIGYNTEEKLVLHIQSPYELYEDGAIQIGDVYYYKFSQSPSDYP